MFVSGGNRKDKEKTIFQYGMLRDTWESLPVCAPTRYHALATLNSQLLVVGGLTSTDITSNQVFTWTNDTWKEFLPPMPTARCHLSTLSHQNELIIAAGGITGIMPSGHQLITSHVEVYFRDKEWCRASNLIFPTSNLTLTVTKNTCYIMLGGVGNFTEDSRITVCAPLSSLIQSAVREF